MSRKRLAILLSLVCLFTSILPVQMVFGKEVVITKSILSEKSPQKTTNGQIEVDSGNTTTEGQIEVDLSGLVDLIKEAEVLVNTAVEGTTPGCYDILDITKFELSIALAKETLKDTKTQQDIDKATVDLQKAIEIFKDSVIVDKEKLDFSKLEQIIEEAETLYKETEVGSAIGNVSESTKLRLSIAIIEAKQGRELAKTQNDINQVQFVLEEAIRLFREAMIRSEAEDANADGTINIADLALVAYYFGVQEGDSNWEQAKYADVNGDEEVNIVDLSILAKKILDK